MVKDVGFASVITGQCLEALFGHSVKETVPLALSMVPAPLPTEEQLRGRAVVAAALLLNHAADAGWPMLWPLMQEEPEFAESVLARLVWDERRTPAAAIRLTDPAVADLYIWLCRRYPPKEDPDINGIVEYRAAVGQWRDGLLTHLRLQGTEEACQAIAKAMAALPEQEWLKWTFLEARSLTRQRTWVPPRPREIHDLVASADRRLIQNADQLMDVVVESLTRLEVNLQLREPPAAIDLWDEVAKNTFKPKDEERLSDYLKRHLDNELGNRGIVFNREVTNRPGEETDIRVEALLRGQNGNVIDLLTVIIEVKGCWHPELWTAMETQLVDRYLGETRTDHGLYVAGWYNCEKWTGDDYKKSRAPRLDKEEAQRRLRRQAEDLSRGGKRIAAVVIDTSLR